MKSILVTGGSGFIGSNFIRLLLESTNHAVLNVDALKTLPFDDLSEEYQDAGRYTFLKGDITDSSFIASVFENHEFSAVAHFAAESHVDRSIAVPEDFVSTNVVGTFRLLEAVRQSDATRQGVDKVKFLHISTDEVFGSLDQSAPAFTESSRFEPNSPYSATKAASDHLVRAYHHTYGLHTLTTNCSNNYGPYQYPEKLIPLCIYNALNNRELPIYGDGLQIRDWLYVDDHCNALLRVMAAGTPGETYNIGGCNEKTNIEVVRQICDALDRLQPREDGKSYAEQIAHVDDRPGHDRRYAIDASKMDREVNWRPAETFESGLEKTVRWYLDNADWVRRATDNKYHLWIAEQYKGKQ